VTYGKKYPGKGRGYIRVNIDPYSYCWKNFLEKSTGD
jgi:hypothetical protein